MIAGLRGCASIVALLLLLAAGAAAGTRRGISDGTLRVPLPPGWYGSVGSGMQGTHPVAWILVANFALPADAARREGTPDVPPGEVVLAVGDFFPTGASTHWPHVDVLRVPRARLGRSGPWWSVRYRGRAVSVRAFFGSRPSGALLSRVERVLAGIRRR